MCSRCDRQLARDLNEDLSLLQGILDVLASQPGLVSLPGLVSRPG